MRISRCLYGSEQGSADIHNKALIKMCASVGRWDVLVVDCVDPGGMLRQGVLEDVRLASELILSQGSVVVPSQLTIRAMCVESEQVSEGVDGWVCGRVNQ